MSDLALKNLNTIPGSPKNDDSSSIVLLTKPCIENGNGNGKVEEHKCEDPVSLSSTVVVHAAVKHEGQVVNSEVEYIESENLNNVDDLESVRLNLLSGLDSKDWVLVCESLNNVRRLSIFHKEVLQDILVNIVTLVVKSLKNPRSALCKTAIMTSADIFSTYGDEMIDSLDPLLVQLLLKASQDKRFVCEAAERALLVMTTSISPTLLLPKLQPHLKNRNPRIRAKASTFFCKSVPRLGVDGIQEFGIDKLVQVAAAQLSDQLPESRESARSLLLELKSVYEKFHVQLSSSELQQPETGTEFQQPETGSWEGFCQSKLSPLSAQAVLRVTSVA